MVLTVPIEWCSELRCSRVLTSLFDSAASKIRIWERLERTRQVRFNSIRVSGIRLIVSHDIQPSSRLRYFTLSRMKYQARACFGASLISLANLSCLYAQISLALLVCLARPFQQKYVSKSYANFCLQSVREQVSKRLGSFMLFILILG